MFILNVGDVWPNLNGMKLSWTDQDNDQDSGADCVAAFGPCAMGTHTFWSASMM